MLYSKGKYLGILLGVIFFDKYFYFGNCVIKNLWEFMYILKMLD